MPNEHRLSDDDVVALLTDAADHVAYPPLPDFSASFRRQSGRSDYSGAALRFPDISAGPRRAGDSTGASAGELTDVDGAGTDWRQASRLVAAGAGLLALGLVVILLLRETRDGSIQQATTDGPAMRDVLISTISASSGPNDFYSYLLIRDAATRAVIHRIPVDLGGWFTVSPDGTRIYAAGDHYMTAIDTRTGGTAWEVPYTDRRLREFGILGLAAPAVSPDGSRLYLYGTETGFTYWIEEIDAATGEKLRESQHAPDPSSGCSANMFPSPDGKSLYLPCRYDHIAILDLETMQWSEALDFAPLSASQPGGGELLYVISNDGEIAVVNMNSRQIVERRSFVDLMPDDEFPIMAHAALSNDGTTLAIVLTDDVVRGPVFAYQYRLYDVGSWEEVNRVTPEDPIVGGGLTPEHSGGFLIVAEEEGGNLDLLRLDRDGLESLGFNPSDGVDARHVRTRSEMIATGEGAETACPVTPETAAEDVRKRFEFGATRTIEAADMYVNFWGTPTVGNGIGYTARMDYPDGYEEGGWYYITLQLVAPVDRDVAVSGHRLDAAGDLRFGETDEPDVNRDVWPAPGMEAIGLGELRCVDARVRGPGCYGMAIQWDGNYETVVFEVVD